MKIRKAEILAFILVTLSFSVAIYLFNSNIIPEKFASHWNIRGTVDGYMSKFWGLFLMPIISFGMILLFFIIPRIDPLKKNIEEFRNYFDGFIILILLFFSYLYMLTILWNLNYRFNMTQTIIPAFAVLFYFVGILIEKSKMNWFIGIKTPWTLNSEIVWTKTHKLGGVLFKISSVISLLGIIFHNYAFYLLIIPILISSAAVILYSYFEFEKEKKHFN